MLNLQTANGDLLMLLQSAGTQQTQTAEGGEEQPQGQDWSGMLLQFGLIAAIVIAFWFFLIRPQKKKEKVANQMRESIKPGDRIVTIGGIMGRVIQVKDDSIIIETTTEHTKLKMLKSAVQTNNYVKPDEKTPSTKKPNKLIGRIKGDKNGDKTSYGEKLSPENSSGVPEIKE